MLNLLLFFLLVFLLNVIPAFAPPTWMLFSFLGFHFQGQKVWILALTGALAATLGRVALAKMSSTIIRRRLLSEKARENVDVLKEKLQKQRKFTFSVFLFYAFTPLPSNYLFIAYGLTALELRLVALPFFLGRYVSYSFWTFTASAAARRLTFEDTEALSYFGIYFVATQTVLLLIVYGFTKIDWRYLLTEKKFRWISTKNDKSPAPKADSEQESNAGGPV